MNPFQLLDEQKPKPELIPGSGVPIPMEIFFCFLFVIVICLTHFIEFGSDFFPYLKIYFKNYSHV